MEARQSYGRTGLSKGFIAVVAVLITLGLAFMAAAVAKNVGGSSATQTHAVSAQPASAPLSMQSHRLGGGKLIDDTIPAPTAPAVRVAPRPAPGHGQLP